MDSEVTSNQAPLNFEDVKLSESAENFQKFIYDLFEKNGVLGDLRSYLRSHIVNVLRSAQTGSIPGCQKNFTQRLELKSQALNIMIAEYLLHMDFTYSFSVFISEMPLANMVFEYAKSLIKSKDDDIVKLSFDSGDVYAILNYLGIQCDSEWANTILNSYTKQKVPLLSCILNNTQFYKKESVSQLETDNSRTSSLHSSESLVSGGRSTRCRHLRHCRACREGRRGEKRLRRKRSTLSDNKESGDLYLKKLMKNMNIVESNLIDEMFDQMKSVYEKEIETLKESEQMRVREAVAAHAQLLKQKAEELEESYRSREASLEANIRKKRQTLFEVAQNLKRQHKHMTEKDKLLSDKEKNIKQQLVSSEDILRKLGEEMRSQITGELSTLENHLRKMQNEKETIKKERLQLEMLKSGPKNEIFQAEISKREDFDTRYDFFKNKISNMNVFIDGCKITEGGKVTELYDADSQFSDHLVKLLSEHTIVKTGDKMKEKPLPVSLSIKVEAAPAQRGCDVTERDNLSQLRLENERLQALAAQQRKEIEALGRPRPRAAPASAPYKFMLQSNLDTAATTTLGREGAGEELTLFPTARARGRFQAGAGNIEPGRDKRRASPQAARKRAPSPRRRSHTINSAEANSKPDINEGEHIASCSLSHKPEILDNQTLPETIQETANIPPNESRTDRVSSKEKIINKPITTQPIEDKNPSPILQEAKRMLRKLEIEAEAVEASYQQYRAQRDTWRGEERTSSGGVATKSSQHTQLDKHEKQDNVPSTLKNQESCLRDFDRFLKKYPITNDFKSKTMSDKLVRPIPNVFSDNIKGETKSKENYLETPLSEFRKYYTQGVRNIKDTVFKLPNGCDGVSVKEEPNSEDLNEDEPVNTDIENKDEHINEDKPENIEIESKGEHINGDKQKSIETEPKDEHINNETVPVELKKENTIAKIEPIAEKKDNVLAKKVKQAEYLIVVENVNQYYSGHNRGVEEKESEKICQQDNLIIEVENFKSEKLCPDDNLIIEVENFKSVQAQSQPENVYDTSSTVTQTSIKPDDVQTIEVVVTPKKTVKDEVDIDEIYQSTERSGKSVESSSNQDYADDFTADDSEALSTGMRSPMLMGATINDDDFWE